MAINAGSVYSELILDTKKYQAGLSKADKDMKGFTSRLGKAGKIAGNVGKQMTTKVTLPVLGLAAASLKVGADFESSMSEVQAISGATGSQLKQMSDKAREMGKTTKFSAKESAQAMKYMAMAGWDTTQIVGGLDGVMQLASASGEDLATVSDIVTDSMTAFGMQAEESARFADVLAAASSNSNTNVGIMGETFKYVAPLAGSMGYTVEDTALAIGLMANAGIKGSQSGTALRSMLTRLISPTDDSAAAMKRLGISITDSNGEIKPLNVLMEDMRKKFQNLTPEQKASAAAQIAGKEAMSGFLAIMNASNSDFAKLQTSINNSTGAAKKMSEVMEDNLKGRIKKLISQLQEIGIQLSQIFIPMAEKAVAKLSEWAEKFSNLDESTQENIVKLGLFAAAIGPVLMAGGRLVSIISGGAKVFGLLKGVMATSAVTAGTTTGAFGTLGLGVGALSAPVLAGAAAVAALGYAGYKTYKHFQEEAIPATDLYGDKVSEATQKAVQGYIDLNDKATTQLKDFTWKQNVMTQEMVDKQGEQYDNLEQIILEKMDKKHAAQLKKTEEYMFESKALSLQEEEEILRDMEESQQKEKEKLQNHKDRIMEIQQRASEEKRTLTTEELEVIDNLNNEMKESAVKNLSETELESKVILEKMKNQSSNITARQAAEIVKNSKKQRDKAVENAEKQYDETVANIIKMRDETGIISEEQAKKLIDEAEFTKKRAVDEAEGMHKNVVKEAKAQAKEHVNEVDWTKGEVKSKWDVMVSNTKSKSKEMWRDTVADVKAIAKKFSDKGEEIKNRWKTVMENVSSKSDDNIGKAKKFIGKGIEGIKKLFDFDLKLPDIKVPKLPKLPKPSISGSFSLNPPRVPSIKWNAEGAIFTKPYIFGNQGVGEAGPEAVLPIEKLSKILADTLKVILPKQNIGNNTITIERNESIDYNKLSNVMLEVIETSNNNKPIIIKLISDGREIAEATSSHVSNNMVLETKRREW